MSDNKDSGYQEQKGPSKLATGLGYGAVGLFIGQIAGSVIGGTYSTLALIGGVAGAIIGAVRGVKKANAARTQFNEITGENRELKGKLYTIETAVTMNSQKSHVADLENQRAKQAAQSASVAV